MSNQTALEAVVVTQNKISNGQTPVLLSLFNADGTPKTFLTTPAAAQANSVATTVADLVTDFNALLAKLRTAGLLAS